MNTFDEINVLRKQQMDFKKQYINYDKLILDLIKQKEQEILKYKIEISQRQQTIMYLENDIKRILEEQEKSNNSFVDCHYFINPNFVYDDMTKPKT